MRVDPGAHGNEQGGQSKIERGKNVEEGSGHGMARASRHTQPAEEGRCRRTQPADDPTGTGLEETTATDVGRSHAVQCRLVEGVRWCWPLRRRAQTYLPVSLPPIAFACHRPYPLHYFVKIQFSPNLFFCFYYFYPFTFPLTIRPQTPFTVSVRLTYGVP